MNKVFQVYVAAKDALDGRSATLCLPATPYELLDVLDKTQVKDIEELYVQVEEYHRFSQIALYLDGEVDLCELNALAQKLSELDDQQSISFEGLVKMEAQKQEPFGIPRLIDLAYSADCCHVVPEASDDAALGRFYAENGFVPKVDDLSDELFELLNFQEIGRKYRTGEGGVFTTRGYVVQHTELNQVAGGMDFTVQPPDYIFRVGVVDCMRDDSGPRKVEYLELPATEEQLNEFPGKLGLEDWMGTAMFSFDGPLPDFDRLIISTDELPELNDLAKRIQTLTARGDLPKYKAVLSAESCQDLDRALSLADALDAYYYMPSLRTVEEAGREELRFLMNNNAAELAMQHINLATYGKAVMERHHAVLTDYGTVERRDGQPIQRQEPEPPKFQMSM